MLGAEVLTEIGLAIKTASPFETTMVVTHCNGSAGYLPPKRLYVEGGYEVESSPFASGAADEVVRRVVALLHELDSPRGESGVEPDSAAADRPRRRAPD